MFYCLAVDIGASSGRHILGTYENGKITTKEIYRFENNIVKQNGKLVWDIEHLFNEVINGIAVCKTLGTIPSTVAIDTWGVDYVLLDRDGAEILPAVSYRDARTNDIQAEFSSILSQDELYKTTGIQKQNFNTVYQLYCDKKSGKLDNAAHMLMIPAYLSYKLTGAVKNEYTNATTTNLVNAKSKIWDSNILNKIGIDVGLLGDLAKPTELIGEFTDEIKARVGFNSKVIFCPSHDTASAVAACPVKDNSVYISSGTWSLIGIETEEPILTEAAAAANFTNEGGINYRFRFLKNIMGMWLLQNVRRNLDKKYTYDEMMNMAMSSSFTELIDPNAPDFVAPDNMIEAVRAYLKKPDLPLKDVLNCIYCSLAASYARAIKEIEEITGKPVSAVNIVGGGCQDGYLNKLTSQYTGKPVFAGPVEATAIGNLISQLMYLDCSITLEKARETVKKSFNITEVI